MRQIITKDLASIYTDVPTLRPGTVGAYALSLASAGVATVVRLAIDPYVMGAECLPFFPAVIITALIGGRDAGLFCVALSTAAVVFLQMPPLTLLLFVLLAIFLVILITRMRLAIQREQAAQTIQASRDRLQFTLDMAKLGSWQYDPRRRVLKGDTRFKEIFDVTTDEMPIENLKKLVHPDDAERFWADREASIDLADPMRSPSHEYRVQRRNAEVRWVEVRWFAYGDRRERGTASVVGAVHDITQRKRAEARLAEREAQLALFVEHAPAAIAMFDDKMRYLAVSRRFLSDYELGDPSDVIGRSQYEVFPDVPSRWREFHLRVLAGEELAEEEDFFPRQNGRIYWVRWSMKPWRIVSGRIGGAMLFAEVITEQVEARHALAESEARFRATFENAAVGIAHAGPDGRWLRVNEALCRIVGYPVDELVTKTIQDITHPDDLAAEVAQVELMRGGKIDSYDIDKRYLRKDGVIVWGRNTVGCVRKSEGSINYFVNVVEDVTARKRAEEELRKSEERFRSSLVHSPLPVALFDDQEQVLAVSRAWLEQTGYSREELRSIGDWTARAYGERSGEIREYIREFMPTGGDAHSRERIIRTKGGHERLWNFVTSSLGTQSDGRRLFICVAQDVTERKAHEEHVHLLMREVNHRAKNMLSLVQAIARQTAARQPEDFIGCFTERIQALAANHDLLVRNDWRGVDLEDLVRAQLAHFADLVGSRIAVRGPKLRLNAAAAQAIGLTLHELATNAGKYGALSTDKGRVDVCWRTDDDTLTVSWTERDGPPVSPPERRGFGSTVIASMAKATVGGEVQLDYAPSGLVWRLTCRAANALESQP